jgi:hypothetical protein
MAFAFAMMNDGEIVPCQISDAAMDDLAETKGTLSIARQAQFVAHRDAIERIASDLFDKAPSIKGYVVRIFSKHIQAVGSAGVTSRPTPDGAPISFCADCNRWKFRELYRTQETQL